MQPLVRRRRIDRAPRPGRRSAFVALTLLASLAAAGCEGDATAPLAETPSTCPGLPGVEGLFWDIMNGVPRGDIPGGVPTIANPGGTYRHPAVPLLGFQYPAGYTPSTDRTPNAIGVNVVRNDNQGLWRYSQIALLSPVRAVDVLNAEANSVIDFLGGNPNQVQVVCERQESIPVDHLAPGFTVEVANAMIRFNGFTSVMTNSVTTTPTGLRSITVQKTAAPTAEHEAEILETFLPISYQLLFTGGGGGNRDSDGDGVPDDQDQCPNTPLGTPVDARGCPRA